MENNITYFAETNFRNAQKRFGIKRRDRAKHTYIIGKTGMGKTTLLENMAIQDIQNGEGIGIIDPHGEFAEKMLKVVPKSRMDDVVYFSPHDIDWPMGFNVMENVDATQRHLVSAGLLGVFKKIWVDAWSARMEYLLSNAILALLEYPGSTLLGINRMFADKEFRKEIVSNITDPVVKAFWVDEFAKYSDKFASEATAAIQNKVGQFVSNPLIRNIIGQSKSSFNIRKIMDEKKILIMNLSKGRIGEENSRLLGQMLVTKIYLAAMSRVDVSEEKRTDFYLYVDEFQNFASESFADILSEARKYRLNLILAHQYIAQMDEKVNDAVFGNVGTMISFRVGAADAEFLEKEFAPEFYMQDIVNLGFASIYLRLMIDGVASRPFSASTLPPIEISEEAHTEEIMEFSRKKYSTPKKDVEDTIAAWHASSTGKEQSSLDKPAPVSESVRQTEEKEPTGGFQRPNKEQPQLYEASCAECGKTTHVPFQPDGKRPVYCQTHRSKQSQKSSAPVHSAPVQQNESKEQMPAPAKNEGGESIPTRQQVESRVPAPAPVQKIEVQVPVAQSRASSNSNTQKPALSQGENKKFTKPLRDTKTSTLPQGEVGGFVASQREIKTPVQTHKEAKIPASSVGQASYRTSRSFPPQSEAKAPTKTMSLKDLSQNLSAGRANRRDESKDSKQQDPKRDELRAVLSEIMKEEKKPASPLPQKTKQETNNLNRDTGAGFEKSGVLKPGDKIKFN